MKYQDDIEEMIAVMIEQMNSIDEKVFMRKEEKQQSKTSAYAREQALKLAQNRYVPPASEVAVLAVELQTLLHAPLSQLKQFHRMSVGMVQEMTKLLTQPQFAGALRQGADSARDTGALSAEAVRQTRLSLMAADYTDRWMLESAGYANFDNEDIEITLYFVDKYHFDVAQYLDRALPMASEISIKAGSFDGQMTISSIKATADKGLRLVVTLPEGTAFDVNHDIIGLDGIGEDGLENLTLSVKSSD